MEQLFDVSVSKSDKICRRDEHGFYQTSEYGYVLTEKNVPESEVKLRSLELRLQIAKFICNSEIIDGRKTVETAKEELGRLEKHLTSWREKNGADEPRCEKANT